MARPIIKSKMEALTKQKGSQAIKANSSKKCTKKS